MGFDPQKDKSKINKKDKRKTLHPFFQQMVANRIFLKHLDSMKIMAKNLYFCSVNCHNIKDFIMSLKMMFVQEIAFY